MLVTKYLKTGYKTPLIKLGACNFSLEKIITRFEEALNNNTLYLLLLNTIYKMNKIINVSFNCCQSK